MLQVHIGDTDGTPKASKTTARTCLSTGSWQMVAFTFDGSESECIIYYNGARKASTWSATAPTTINSEATVPLTVGCDLSAGSAQNFFDGKFDCLAIYDDVLTPEEILYIYNSGNGNEGLGLTLEASVTESVGVTDTETTSIQEGVPHRTYRLRKA